MILYKVFEIDSIQNFREFPDAQNTFQKEKTSVSTLPSLANGFDSVFDSGTPLGSFGLPLLFGTPAPLENGGLSCVVALR